MGYAQAYVPDDRIVGEIDELSLVMREMADAMAADRAMLSIHPSDAPASMIAYLDDANPAAGGDHDAAVMAASAFAAFAQDALHRWRKPSADTDDSVLLISVSAIPGHSRLVISLFFDALDETRRRRAEDVYDKRRPFAVGYFRLWQLDRIRRRRSEALEGALDLTEIGVLLIARSGEIVFANAAAEKCLAAGDGLRRVNGALRATDLCEGVRLQVAINYVNAADTRGPSGGEGEAASVLALPRRNGPPLTISLLAPQIRGLEPSDVAAIMFIVDPQVDTRRMLEPVCRLYRLSLVETQLASHLAQGRTLALASQLMRIKEQTARGYMKQIFSKTATNRQTELIVLMLSSVVRMRNGLTQRALG